MKSPDSDKLPQSDQISPIDSSDEAIYQLVYVSLAVRDFDQEDLISILDTSRKFNAQHEISGLLLYSDRNIIQILEGQREAVRILFEKIRIDPRHQKVTLLSFEKAAKRDFKDWAMGFKRVGTDRFNQELPNFTDIVERKNLNFELLSGLSIKVGFILNRFSHMNRLDDLKSAS